MTGQSNTAHGRNQKGLNTLAVHAGEEVDPTTRASAPNLVMSTTYVVDTPKGFSAEDGLDLDGDFIYTRWGNPTVRQLERKLAALEGAEAGLGFASGMAASAGLLLARLSAGDHLITSDTNYAGTAELIRNTLGRMNIQISAVDSSDPANVAAAIRQNTRMIWLETPANPILRLSDIAAIAKLTQGTEIELAVDSTFATPMATRPLELGAHWVVHSLTKYIGGHGDALGGAVLGTRSGIARLAQEAGVHLGGTLSPFNAWLIMRGAATLPLRMKAHEQGAMEVAKFLEGHPRVSRVLYPGLPSHPQHDLARRQMKNFSGMISFCVHGDGPGLANRMMENLGVIHYAVSLGHHRSLIFWIGTEDLMASTFKLEGAQRDAYRAMAGDGVFRLSIGLEDPDDLIADLDQALS